MFFKHIIFFEVFMSNHILETVDLTLKIEDKLIFQNINLKVGKGTIHALIGVNGCGKSSIASVLMGLKKPTKGKKHRLHQKQTEEETPTKYII